VSILSLLLFLIPFVSDPLLQAELQLLYAEKPKPVVVEAPVAIPAPTRTAPLQFTAPLDQLMISGWTFHDPRNPSHEGIDWGCAPGTSIYAAESGQMHQLWNPNCGNYALIWHRDGWATGYCHLDSFTAGGHVSKGQVIGRCGNTGASTGPHLHFVILKDRIAVDPLTLIP
jgi:murein DD-endopeptidase MepM/ murein hydrolase activator NlpD